MRSGILTSLLPSRPTWDETRIEMARVIARRSLCSRDRVGAIIVDFENKIIGEGYNGPPRLFNHGNLPCDLWCSRVQSRACDCGFPGEGGLLFKDKHLSNCAAYATSTRKTDYSDCPSLHAEANALMMSARSLRVGGIMYVTSHPCFPCAKLIANSGLMGLYVHTDEAHEYRNDPAVYKFLTDLEILVRIVQ